MVWVDRNAVFGSRAYTFEILFSVQVQLLCHGERLPLFKRWMLHGVPSAGDVLVCVESGDAHELSTLVQWGRVLLRDQGLLG